MAKQKKQQFEGIVYSTDSNFEYDDVQETFETLPVEKQRLKVLLDKKSRKGKIVTAIEGFVGKEDDLQDLAKLLKQKCGVGGSVKDGIILIQGDLKTKVYDYLVALGYKVKLVGG